MKYLGSHFIKISCVNIKVFSPLDRREAGVKIINQPTIWLSLTNENQVWSWRLLTSDVCDWESDVRPGVGPLISPIWTKCLHFQNRIPFHFIFEKIEAFLIIKNVKMSNIRKTFFGSKVFLFKVISFCLFEKFFFETKPMIRTKTSNCLLYKSLRRTASKKVN